MGFDNKKITSSGRGTNSVGFPCFFLLSVRCALFGLFGFFFIFYIGTFRRLCSRHGTLRFTYTYNTYRKDAFARDYTAEFLPIISPFRECTTRPSNSAEKSLLIGSPPFIGEFNGSISSSLRNKICGEKT